MEYFEIIRCSRGRMATLSIDPMFGQAALSVPQQEHGTQRTQYAHLALPRSGLFVHHPKSAIIELYCATGGLLELRAELCSNRHFILLPAMHCYRVSRFSAFLSLMRCR